MIEVEFAGTIHPIYTAGEAKNRSIEISPSWRTACTGEWVQTDTGFVLEVLADGVAGTARWIRTCCGTYLCTGAMCLSHIPRRDRYRFSGEYPKHSVTRQVRLFVEWYIRIGDHREAYRRAFPNARSEKYIRERSSTLLNAPAVREEIGNALERILRDNKITRDWTISEIKGIHDAIKDRKDPDKTTENDALRFRILKFLDEKAEAAENAPRTKSRIKETQVYSLPVGVQTALRSGQAINRSPDKHTLTVTRELEGVEEVVSGVPKDHDSGGNQGDRSD
jgi:hypothetical protein